MSAKTFLFTGEESYLVEKEVRRWKDSFSSKYWKDNISVYTPHSFDVAAISNDLLGSGLFAEKKLVVIYGIPDDGFAGHKLLAAQTWALAELIEKKRSEVNPDSIVVFVSYKPDKRKKLYKFLSWNVTKHQDFPPMTWKRLVRIFAEQSDLLNDELAGYIVERVGSSFARLMTELAKLEAYAEYHNMTALDKKTIDEIVYGEVETDTFALLDVLYLDKDKSLVLVDRIRDNWVNRNQVIGALYRGVKVFVLYADCLKRKVNSKQIPKDIWVHPFVISKHSKNHRVIVSKEEQFKQFLLDLLELDYAIKSGKLDASVFWLQLKQAILRLNA